MEGMPRPGTPSQVARTVRSSVFARMAKQLAEYKGDLIPLHMGDTYLLPPEEVRSHPPEEFGPDSYRYGSAAGAPELLDALAGKLKRKNGLDWARPSNIQVTGGATHALYAASRAILDFGDEVLVPSPYWPLIQGIVRLCGGVPREAPFYQQLYRQPGADPRALLEPEVTSRTVAIYLISPNNPDGKMLTRAQLERVAELARDRDLWVIADEVYEDYVYNGTPHVSFASLPGMAERTLTAYSFSKSHAMAGMRLGYLVGPEGAIGITRKICNHTLYSVPLHLQRAAVRALAHSAGFLSHAYASYRAARQEAVASVRAPFFQPEGASYLFLDLSGFGPSDAPDCHPVLERLLDAGVLLAPGDAFGDGFAGYARLCFTAVDPPRLREAIARLNQVLEELARR
jgi:aspartate/methionine/tyrosine aminotransferase